MWLRIKMDKEDDQLINLDNVNRLYLDTDGFTHFVMVSFLGRDKDVEIFESDKECAQKVYDFILTQLSRDNVREIDLC